MLYFLSSLLCSTLTGLLVARGHYLLAVVWAVVTVMNLGTFLRPERRGVASGFVYGIWAAVVLFNVIFAVTLLMAHQNGAALEPALGAGIFALWIVQSMSAARVASASADR